MGACLAARRRTRKHGIERRYRDLFAIQAANYYEVSSLKSKRHDDLAEMLVGFHVLERLADVVEGKHLVDRQLQPARFHRAPEILFDLVKNLADLLDRAGAEGDADIGDAARGMQVEIELGAGAAKATDIDDAALDPGRCEILACDLAGDLIDDEVDAFAARRLQHLVHPAEVGRIDRKIGAVV